MGWRGKILVQNFEKFRTKKRHVICIDLWVVLSPFFPKNDDGDDADDDEDGEEDDDDDDDDDGDGEEEYFPGCEFFYSCPKPGTQPKAGDGDVKIVLTPEGQGVLEKVPALKRWSVAPPMTRGSKNLAEKAANSKKNTAGNKKQKPKVKIPKRVKKGKKDKKDKKHKRKPVAETSELNEASFRRHERGRDCIRAFMRDLFQQDENAFASAPAFDAEGFCRMKFEGAKDITWCQVLESSPLALEQMRFN